VDIRETQAHELDDTALDAPGVKQFAVILLEVPVVHLRRVAEDLDEGGVAVQLQRLVPGAAHVLG